MTPAAPALRQRAEQLASTLPPLQVAAERIATTVTQGVHGRRRVGQGETFWQFRRYEPGDSPNKIDWRQSAKSQPIFVRETEWAAAQSIWLWRDGSSSMGYRSSGELPEKLERANLITMALAALLIRGGERIALLGSPRRPSSGQSALNHLALELMRPAAERDSLPAVLPLPRHANLVLIGDFLSPLPEINALVHGYAEEGVNGHILQLIDPAEETLPFAGRVQFEGMEGEGETLMSRVETVRDDYAKRFASHHQGLRDLARAVGWSCAQTRTDRAPQAALLALFLQLDERKRF
ncbi:MAG: DUF58 domain-containing protein [Dongiaceae bacterium]